MLSPRFAGLKARDWEQWRITPALRPLRQDVVERIEQGLWVVMGTMGIVLLIACANVTNLLLVRAEARERELAVRAALGVGWGQIVRQLLAESLALGLLGGLSGVAIAAALRRGALLCGAGCVLGLGGAVALSSLMKSLLFGVTPLDPMTYAVMPVVLLVATLAACYFPAKRAAAVDPVETLRAE